MNKKMSELFHEFVHDNDFNGNDEIIRETNAVVAEDDIEVRTMLDDGVGEKYFYRCMELAENVIKSFKDEQSQLNDNQQIVLEWLKGYLVDDCDFRNTLEQMYSLQINGIAYKKENLAFMKLTERELAQVVQVFSNWFLEQEEENNDH
ncbi:hypothetical protein [Enterococcus thailandicus]|uniref:hypothetical protein n=1 Tax=Enterococcus thailandicus TaxID=417368 RepID=UPI0034DD7061